MKSFVTICALAAYANAAANTFNDCLSEEGSVWIQDCRSLWYAICDNYYLLPGETCNVETFGDASINWFSDSIDVFVWRYIERYPDDVDESDFNTDEWSRLRQDAPPERECLPESLGSELYESEQKLQAKQGNCGFKFQLINNSEFGAYDFTVLRAGSEALAATILASTAVLALF